MVIDSDDDDDDETTDEIPQSASGHRTGPGRGKSLMGSVKNILRLFTGSPSKVPSKSTQAGRHPEPEPDRRRKPNSRILSGSSRDLSREVPGF